MSKAFARLASTSRSRFIRELRKRYGMLSRFLKRQVPADVRQRGFDYFRSRRVVNLKDEGRTLVAEVKGTEYYRVILGAEPPRGLRVTCSCPFFADRDRVCKHIWAVLLEADRQGWPRRIQGPPKLLLGTPLGQGSRAPRGDYDRDRERDHDR